MIKAMAVDLLCRLLFSASLAFSPHSKSPLLLML
jgi:hypothetical protein